MRQKLCIRIFYNNLSEIEKIFRALFAKGFVYQTTKRYKTWDEINTNRNLQMADWILIGFDEDCKMVLETGSGNWNGMGGFLATTFDEFITLFEKGAY